MKINFNFGGTFTCYSWKHRYELKDYRIRFPLNFFTSIDKFVNSTGALKQHEIVYIRGRMTVDTIVNFMIKMEKQFKQL